VMTKPQCIIDNPCVACLQDKPSAAVPARLVTPTVKPAAPAAPPADPEPLKEGTAYYDALAADVPEEAVVPEKHLMSMVNKLMRKDKDNMFKVEPQKGSLSSRIVCPLLCACQSCPIERTVDERAHLLNHCAHPSLVTYTYLLVCRRTHTRQ
jgi:hypothetical protein